MVAWLLAEMFGPGQIIEIPDLWMTLDRICGL
jgi:hypothetical protein